MTDSKKVGRVIAGAFGDTTETTYSEGEWCGHRRYLVDGEAWVVMCQACGEELDPIQILLDYARAERRHHDWSKETSNLLRRVTELKAEEVRVKARTKNAARKDANVAVAEERARWERKNERAMNRLAEAQEAVTRAVQAFHPKKRRKPPRVEETTVSGMKLTQYHYDAAVARLVELNTEAKKEQDQ